VQHIEKPQLDPETQKGMDYGNVHEIDAIATVPSLILPLFYPDLKYFEEGCLKVPHERNESFLVVSPDGSFRESEYATARLIIVSSLIRSSRSRDAADNRVGFVGLSTIYSGNVFPAFLPH
jgi:hypothetical protein